MRARDLTSETVMSLTSNGARSFLTILGIVVGIMAVIVMVSLGNGTKASINGQIQSVGSNLLMVMPNADTTTAQDLTLADSAAIAKVPGVGTVAPATVGQYSVIGNSDSVNVGVTGATESYAEARSITTSSGAWFSADDVSRGSRVVVLGSQTADDLFGTGSDPVGQRVRINGTQFTVVGLAASKGSSGMQNTDEAAYVPLRAQQLYLSGEDGLSIVYVTSATQEGMDAVKYGIENVLMSRHDINDSANADFQITSMGDLAKLTGTITSLLTVLLGSIAGISLLVGGIGIMNMMLTNVTERIREIGLRKAIGATRSDITSQFLAEAVALTMIGGIIGIALGWGISEAITALSTFTAVVTSGSVLLAFGVSTAIGLVFGYYPARQAAKMDPIDALRYQ